MTDSRDFERDTHRRRRGLRTRVANEDENARKARSGAKFLALVVLV